MRPDYREAVLDLVATIPAGRATTYGTIAQVLRGVTGSGGPRQVGRIMAVSGGQVPWWRVVNTRGEPAPAYRDEALARLREEGCPLTADGRRVDLRRAGWWPEITAAAGGS